MVFAGLETTAHSERPSYKSEEEAGSQRHEEDLKADHVLTANALRGPRAVMVELFDAEVAKFTVLSVHVLPGNCLTMTAKFCLTKQ